MRSRRKVRLGFIGGGAGSLIGFPHRAAAYYTEQFDIVSGAFSSDSPESRSFGESLGLEAGRSYDDIDALIAGELALPEGRRTEVVSVLTPNWLHYACAKKLLEAGFHVLCEKPLALTTADAIDLTELVAKHKKVFAVAHTYTGYPMLRQMREMIAAGAIGKVHKIDGQYYQGWINQLIHDPQQRASVWRLDPEKSGQSCCMADIGVHVFNLIEYATGLTVDQVLADTDTLDPENPLDVDGVALIKTTDGTRGLIRASQVATGEENNLVLSVYGHRGGLIWRQETPDVLRFMPEGAPQQLFKPGHDYNHTLARESAHLPPGHPEGLVAALANLYHGVASAVRGESTSPAGYPDVEAGTRGMRFIEAVMASSRQGQVWVSL